VDEISHRKGQRYLTVVVDHDTGRLVWAAPGQDRKTMERFLDELGEERCAQLELISCDMASWITLPVAERCPNAEVCLDAFHVVKLATEALDAVRRQVWQSARKLRDKTIAKKYKGARWALLKNPGDLNADQTGTLREIKKSGGALWRAYQLKESLRAVFAGDLDTETTNDLLDRWCSKAQRSRIPEFVKTARTIRKHRDGITAALDRGLSNGRHEGLNNKVRLIIRRAYGFHTAKAALATIMLTCGPVNLQLPYHTPATHM
jgi:transposase